MDISVDEYKEIYKNLNDDVPKGNKNKFFSGPKGLGDPDDLSLTFVEKTMLIPATKKEIIKKEYCFSQLSDNDKCYGDYRYFRRFHCANSRRNLTNCVKKFMSDSNLDETAKNKYLEKRSLYRLTGLTEKQRMNPTVQKRKAKWIDNIIRFKTPEEYAESKHLNTFERIKYSTKSKSNQSKDN